MPSGAEEFATRFPELASALDEAGVQALLEAFETHDAQAGEALVAEGTASSALFLVLDGQLDVTTSAWGGEQRVARLGPGSLFGEVALLDPGPAGASVVTEQGCTLLRLTRDRFDELARSHPPAAASVLGEALRALAPRLRAVGARAREAAA